MAHKLAIRDGELRGALSAIRDSCADFELAQDESNTAADACGHKGLANVLRKAASSWSVRRGKLIQVLDGLGDQMQQTIDVFDKTDEELGAMLSSSEPERSVTQSSPASVTQSSMASVPQSSTASPAGADDSHAMTGTAARSVVDAPADAAGPRSDAVLGASPVAAPTSSSGLPADVAGVRVSSPTFDAVPSMVGPAAAGPTQTTVAADADPRLSRANVEQLITALINRWQSLGGAEQAVIGALTAAGVGGVAASVHARASGTAPPPGTSDAGGGKPGTLDANSGSPSSMTPPIDPALATSDEPALAAAAADGPPEAPQEPSVEALGGSFNAVDVQGSPLEAGQPPMTPLAPEVGLPAQAVPETLGQSGLAAQSSGQASSPVVDLPPLTPLAHEELVAPSLGGMPSLATDSPKTAVGSCDLPPLGGGAGVSEESTSVGMLPPLGAAMGVSGGVGRAAAPASGADSLADDAAGDTQTPPSDREEQVRLILHGLRDHRLGEEDRS